MKNCTLLFLMCGFLLGSCGSMESVCNVMVINDSDYEAVNIKLAYLYINGNTLFGDKDKKKKIEMGAIPHGSYKKVTLTYSDPILTTCTSLAVIEYYINGVKYGGDEFDADYPAETLRDGGNFVFIIKNDRYETS